MISWVGGGTRGTGGGICPPACMLKKALLKKSGIRKNRSIKNARKTKFKKIRAMKINSELRFRESADYSRTTALSL